MSRKRRRGRMSAQKGAEGERELAKKLNGRRTKVRGVPSPDVIDQFGIPWEVKRRKRSFEHLYAALEQTEGVNHLAVRDDYKGWLVVLPIEVYMEERGYD